MATIATRIIRNEEAHKEHTSKCWIVGREIYLSYTDAVSERNMLIATSEAPRFEEVKFVADHRAATEHPELCFVVKDKNGELIVFDSYTTAIEEVQYCGAQIIEL